MPHLYSRDIYFFENKEVCFLLAIGEEEQEFRVTGLFMFSPKSCGTYSVSHLSTLDNVFARFDHFFTHVDLPLILHLLSLIQNLFSFRSSYIVFLNSTFCHSQLSQINALLSIILTEPLQSSLLYWVACVCAHFLALVQNTLGIFYSVVLSLPLAITIYWESRGTNWGWG